MRGQTLFREQKAQDGGPEKAEESEGQDTGHETVVAHEFERYGDGNIVRFIAFARLPQLVREVVAHVRIGLLGTEESGNHGGKAVLQRLAGPGAAIHFAYGRNLDGLAVDEAEGRFDIDFPPVQRGERTLPEFLAEDFDPVVG